MYIYIQASSHVHVYMDIWLTPQPKPPTPQTPKPQVEQQQGFVDESRNTVEEANSALLYQVGKEYQRCCSYIYIYSAPNPTDRPRQSHHPNTPQSDGDRPRPQSTLREPLSTHPPHQPTNQPTKKTHKYINTNASSINPQMEIDRVKFILARYLRARLRKIEKRVLHIALSPEMLQRCVNCWVHA